MSGISGMEQCCRVQATASQRTFVSASGIIHARVQQALQAPGSTVLRIKARRRQNFMCCVTKYFQISETASLSEHLESF